ncbi:MAG: sulfatase-like hydrolase/transferase [Bacteroidia bacterium]
MAQLFFLRCSMFILVLLFISGGCHVANETQPNIIVILVDDAGYADFGFMGSPDLATPQIDKLAQRGMIFTDAHVTASVCGPSRAGLMSGQYQQRFGFECNPPQHFAGIDIGPPTMAESLQAAGYRTAAFGKWHLGDVKEARPLERGFDYFWGFLAGGRHYFPHAENDREGDLRSIQENGAFTTFDGYLTDVLGDKAVDFIDRNADEPFFMYWAPNAVHTPMEATAEDLARFENHPRQTLAAMTWALDRSVGKIVSKLEAEDLLDNTLIFFLSDNGGATNNQSTNGALKGFKGNEFEGGHRVAFFAHWPSEIKAGQEFTGLSSSLDIFATAVDAAKASLAPDHALDGVSLLPYFRNEMTANPHKRLFWRKDGMAAAREGEMKLIRVDSLGHRLYDLGDDLGETTNLVPSQPDNLQHLSSELTAWEKGMKTPRWTESEAWNQVTWFIHRDLFDNKKVSIKRPSQLPTKDK